MKRFYSLALLAALFVFSCDNTSTIEETAEVSAEDTPNYLELGVMCGTVQFTDGCSPQIDSLIQFGLALVHHMTYEDAEYNFNKVVKLDPDCFWGHWGRAMTYIHPVWPDSPSKERMRRGLGLARKALGLAKNERESLFGEALLAYYENGKDKSELERLKSYEAAWKKASDTRPDDIEARLFHGLCRLGTVSPSDKSYQVQREVGAMAEDVLLEISDHPGGFHYAIHAYDFPPLASDAMRVANNYAEIAPEIPHALHMPTHIFTRLGYWQESIDMNIRSANAAWTLPADGNVSLHYFHALDYLVYAYLQKSQSKKAYDIVAGIDTIYQTFQSHSVTAYALAAMPARLVLENQDWEAASKLELRYDDYFTWDKFPQFASLSHFAKGVGGARIGNTEIAQEAFDILDSIHSELKESPSLAYWAKQVEIQKTAVKGWHSYASGNKSEGMAIMNEAALMEASTEKSPVTPGELLPVREMLGDLYLAENNPELALENYKLTLERNPNRFNALYGAGKAAEMLNKTDEARKFYSSLLQLGDFENSTKLQIKDARSALASG